MRSQKPCVSGNGVFQSGLRPRPARVSSVVFCDGTTRQEIVKRARKLLAQHQPLWCLGFRPRSLALRRLDRRAAYHELARAVTVHDPKRKLRGDVVMPGMDGADTLRAIRQRVPALTVVMMGAMMTPGLRRHLCHIGAQSCVAKPMDRKDLALALFPWCFP